MKVFVLALVSALAFSPLAPDTSSQTPGEKLAQQIVTALETTPHLEMKIEVRQNDAILSRIHTYMGVEKLRTMVFDPDGELVVAISLYDGRVQEFHPTFSFGNHTLSRPMISYEAPHSYGTKNIYLDTPFDCGAGSYLNTWIGPGTRMSSFFAHVASSGTPELVTESDRKVWRVVEERPWEDGGITYTDKEILLVDAETFLPLTLTSIQQGPDGIASRTRTITIVHHGSEPERFTWTLDAKTIGAVRFADAGRKEATPTK